MANKYAVASGLWSATSTWSDTDGGGGGAAVPADGDAVFISAAVNVQMDADLSAYTGLFAVTIRGDNTTPGMLYFKNGTSGFLKIRTGYNLAGTSGTTYKGRLLANSDGVWANSTALAFANKAIIGLGATSQIAAQYLDIKLLCDQPTYASVGTYGTIYTVTGSASADTLTKTSHGWANTTPIMVRVSGGSLPAPLQPDSVYYVVNTATDTFKVASVSGGTAIDLTTDGTGTIEAYTGHTNTGTATINVLTDITSDTRWVTTTDHNRVVIVDAYAPEAYDQQRVTLTTIAAGTIVLSANIDSAQYPGAKIYLISRNVLILSACVTAVNIVDYTTSATHGGIFQCCINSTAGTGTTFYGTGINYGTGHTISGTVAGCSTDFRLNTGANEGTVVFVRPSATLTIPPVISRNSGNCGKFAQGVFCEGYNKILGASKAFMMAGTVTKNTAIYNNAASSLEVEPLSSCSINSMIRIFEWTEIDVPASGQTKSIYIKGEAWSSFPSGAELYLEAEYISNGTSLVTSVAASSQVLTDNTTWTQLSVTFTPAVAANVRYRAYLGKYEAGCKIYVDNRLV